MPPKKKPAKPAEFAPVSARSTRAATRAAGVAAKASVTTQPDQTSPPAPNKAAPRLKKPSAAPKKADRQQPDAVVFEPPDNEVVTQQTRAAAMNGKRKRNSVQSTVQNDGDVEMATVPPEKKKKESKASLAKFSLKRCEGWFVEYADPDTNEINGNTFGRWFKDLDVSSEGAFMYYILWKCNAATTMTITREEFVKAMKGLDVDTNEKLIKKLPLLMVEVKPPAQLGSNKFMDFYKWCFIHFKASDQAKNIPLEIAEVLFETLLDEDKYSPNWKSEEAAPDQLIDGSPRLNHVHAFIEFLKSKGNTAKVITRDQYQQFAQFNHDVAWDLKGYSEETSTWPTLIDSYVTWKTEHYPA